MSQRLARVFGDPLVARGIISAEAARALGSGDELEALEERVPGRLIPAIDEMLATLRAELRRHPDADYRIDWPAAP